MSDIIKDPLLISAIQDLGRGNKSEADLCSLTTLLCSAWNPMAGGSRNNRG